VHAVEVAPRVIPRQASNQTTSPSVSRRIQTKPAPANNQIVLNPPLVKPETAPSQPTVNAEAGIPSGTTIDMSNWVRYQQYMPVGMVQLFEGNYPWKMPRDIEIDVGPTATYSLPKGYEDATRRYSSAVRIVHLTNGAY